MAKTGWLLLFPYFFSLFLLFWLKKNELVSVIALYSEKLGLEKAAYAIVFEVTEKWKKFFFSLGTTLDLLISFLRTDAFKLKIFFKISLKIFSKFLLKERLAGCQVRDTYFVKKMNLGAILNKEYFPPNG